MIRPNGSRRRQNGGKSLVSNNSRRTAGEEGTHDDMYAESIGTGTTGRVDKLFNELLGENASALGSKLPGGGAGEESTAMSSIFKKIPSNNGDKDKGLGKISEMDNIDNNGMQNKMMAYNSSNSPTLNQLKASRQQQQRQQQQQNNNNAFDEETDADTLMTKPREISFDQNADDVSALFGGHGGVSGVESYMGTAAVQRKNRGGGNRSGGAGMGTMGMFGARGGSGRNHHASSGGNHNRHDGENTTRETRESMGVTTILEDIGLSHTNTTKKKDKGDADSYSEEENKGHTRDSRWSRSRNSRNTRSGNNNNHSSPSKKQQNKRRKHSSDGAMTSNTWVVIVVCTLFVAIQFTTVQKRDKATMDHMRRNRFNDHRYPTAGNTGGGNTNENQRYASAGGLSPGLRKLAMENVESSGGGGGGRRRRKDYDNEDGLGDVLRKTVPLIQDGRAGRIQDEQRKIQTSNREWEKDGSMMDDMGGLTGKKNSNLRGRGQQQQPQRLPPPPQPKQPQFVPPQQQQQQQPPRQMGPPQMQQPLPQNVEVGDTHPLLAPRMGLSLEKATDKLSDMAELRPQQQLSNDIVPGRFKVFADLKSPYLPGRDTPFFWHIPRSGGVVVKTMLSHCLRMTLAAEVGELEGHDKDTELKVISFAEHNYTNVNIATPEGISRALNMGLVPSHLSHTIVSAHVDLVPSLFNANDRARAFVLFRHPVDRAASMFYFLKGTGYPPLKNMTVDDYAKSELIENNWLVRILSESMTGPINMDNLEIAKEVLRKKFIVGLLDNKRGSFARFDHYFKWKDSPNYEKEFGCRKQLMDEKYSPKHPIRKDSDTWKLLLEQNRFDVHLYDFAKELFQQQSYIFGL